MDSVQFSLAGLSDFLVYFGLCTAFVAIYLAIYTRVTPYREIALIREGNTAAAASLSGSLVGFAFPLASSVTYSLNPWDMALWAGAALLVQLLAYGAVRLVLPQLARDIAEGKAASGVFLGAASLAAGILNAACMSY